MHSARFVFLHVTCLIAFGVCGLVNESVLHASTDGVHALTAQDQAKGSALDIETTRLIREEVVYQKGLSTAAKNIQIVTLRGEVTLKGTVLSAMEKQVIAAIAERIANRSAESTALIHNELEISAN